MSTFIPICPSTVHWDPIVVSFVIYSGRSICCPVSDKVKLNAGTRTAYAHVIFFIYYISSTYLLCDVVNCCMKRFAAVPKSVLFFFLLYCFRHHWQSPQTASS